MNAPGNSSPTPSRYPDCHGDCGDNGIYCCDGGWDTRKPSPRSVGSVSLYCEACNEVHRFTPGDTERIVYALLGMEHDARLSHANGEEAPSYHEAHGYRNVEWTCLKTVLDLAGDIEGYAEHVTGSVEARRG